jgi:hypothetical protein
MADLPPLTSKDEVITKAAALAGTTKVEMEKCYNALRETYKDIASQPKFQRFNILDLVMAEERKTTGTTNKKMGQGGNKKYSTNVFSFRQSDDLSQSANT